jgi:hypothetical protein
MVKWIGAGVVAAGFLVIVIMWILPVHITVLGSDATCGPAVVRLASRPGEDAYADEASLALAGECGAQAKDRVLAGGVIGACVVLTGLGILLVGLRHRLPLGGSVAR